MVVDAIVATKIAFLFPEAERVEALRLVEAPDDRRSTRLQLAMLKNSKGSIELLAQQAKLAEIDYRDVLALAEYPRQLRTPAAETTDEMRLEDRKEYESWLEGNE